MGLNMTTVPLKNQWRNYDNGYGKAYVRVQGFLCMLSGVITGPTFGHIASLPPHCRPKKQLAFALSNHYEHMRVNVLPNGDVLWAGGSLQYKWTSLSGITFSMS